MLEEIQIKETFPLENIMATRKTKKATEVAVDTTKYLAQRMSTFDVEIENLTFVMKTLPTPVISYIISQTTEYKNVEGEPDKDGNPTTIAVPKQDFHQLMLLTCKFATIDIKGLQRYKLDKDNEVSRNKDGEIVYENVKVNPGFFQIMNRKFPCLLDEIMDIVPADVFYLAFSEYEDVATVTPEEKIKQDFSQASDETDTSATEKK